MAVEEDGMGAQSHGSRGIHGAIVIAKMTWLQWDISLSVLAGIPGRASWLSRLIFLM